MHELSVDADKDRVPLFIIALPMYRDLIMFSTHRDGLHPSLIGMRLLRSRSIGTQHITFRAFNLGHPFMFSFLSLGRRPTVPERSRGAHFSHTLGARRGI